MSFISRVVRATGLIATAIIAILAISELSLAQSPAKSMGYDPSCVAERLAFVTGSYAQQGFPKLGCFQSAPNLPFGSMPQVQIPNFAEAPATQFTHQANSQLHRPQFGQDVVPPPARSTSIFARQNADNFSGCFGKNMLAPSACSTPMAEANNYSCFNTGRKSQQNCYPADCATSLYGGFEFLWMRAHFDQNVAMIIDPPIGNVMRPFDYSFDFTPRVWLGWQSCNDAGFRLTYWQFSAAAAEERVTAVTGATPVYLFVYGAGGNLTRNAYADLTETLVSNHSLSLQAWDIEGTQKFTLGSVKCLAGVGVRLADMDQNLRGEVYNAANALWEVVTNDLSFQGVGPTASLQLNRCLSNSSFSTFGSMRGAFLFSDTQQNIYEMKDGYTTELVDIANQTEVLTMGECALGVQYSQCIGTTAQLFVRGNYECQAWFDVGGPVDSHSTVSLDGIGLSTGILY